MTGSVPYSLAVGLDSVVLLEYAIVSILPRNDLADPSLNCQCSLQPRSVFELQSFA